MIIKRLCGLKCRWAWCDRRDGGQPGVYDASGVSLEEVVVFSQWLITLGIQLRNKVGYTMVTKMFQVTIIVVL